MALSRYEAGRRSVYKRKLLYVYKRKQAFIGDAAISTGQMGIWGGHLRQVYGTQGLTTLPSLTKA